MRILTMLAWLAFTLVATNASAETTKNTDPPTRGVLQITSGNASVGWDEAAGPAADNCGFSYGGTDHCFQHQWMFRVNADTQETDFPPPDNVLVEGSKLTATWANVAGRGLFAAVLTMRVFDAGGNSAEWRQAMAIMPLTPNPVNLRIYHYLDLDADASFGDTNAALLHANDLIEVSKTSHLFYRGAGADRHEVQLWPQLLSKLRDTETTELANSGTPFGPADFTSALQWNHLLRPERTVNFEAIVGLNRPAMPQGSTVLNFDETARPAFFNQVLAAGTEYAAQGMMFGTTSGQGMGFLDITAFGSTDGESPPNALAFNDNLVFQDGFPVGTSVLFYPIDWAKRVEVRGASSLGGDLILGCVTRDRGDFGTRWDYRPASTNAEHLVLDGNVGFNCVLTAPLNSSGFFDDMAFTTTGRWSFDTLTNIGCSESAIRFNTTMGGHQPALPYTYETIVRANGLTYMHEAFQAFGSNLDGLQPWELYRATSGGTVNGIWPLPSDTPIQITAILNSPEGGVDQITNVTLSRCNGGAITSNTIVYDRVFEDGLYANANRDSQ